MCRDDRPQTVFECQGPHDSQRQPSLILEHSSPQLQAIPSKVQKVMQIFKTIYIVVPSRVLNLV